MVDFYAGWWGVCNRLDTDTFGNKDVISYCRENFINLKINTDTKYGYEVYRQFDITTLPTILFLDSNGNKIEMIEGYHGPKDYLRLIENITSTYNNSRVLDN